MLYNEFEPTDALRPFVECFWTLSSGGRPAPPDTGTILPDGGVELVVNFADAVHRDASDAGLDHLLVGQMDRWTKVAYAGRVDLLCVRFHPAGARPFLGAPLDDFTGRVFALDAAVGRLRRRIARELDPEWPTHRRIAALERILLDRLAGAAPRDRMVESAVTLLQRTQGQMSVSSLMGEFRISGRQLDRRFRRAVGLGPKLLARVLRFRHAWDSARAEPQNWSGLAAACGYYDQAHLIRDFRQFAGRTPAAAMSEFSNTSV